MRASKLSIFSFSAFLLWLTLYFVRLPESDFLAFFSLVFLPIFVFGIFVLVVLKGVQPFSVAPYFLLSVFLFFCINIVLWPVSSQSPLEFFSLVSEVITIRRMGEAATLLGLSLSITFFTYSVLSGGALRRFGMEQAPLRRDSVVFLQLSTVGARMVYFSFPIMCYRLYLEYSYISSLGYLAMYTEGLNTADVGSGWTSPFTLVFYVGFGLVCAFSDSRKLVVRSLIMFVVVGFLDGIKGARGAVIVPILFGWWFYSSRFGVRLRPSKAVGYVFAAMGLFLGLTFFRDPEQFGASFLFFFIDSISSQARSLQLTAIFLDMQEAVERYGNFMVFSNLTLPFNILLHPELVNAPQSVERVLYSNNLKHVLTYVLNPDYYLAGGGVGGVYLIELVESGFFLFVLLSGLLGFFLASLPGLMQYPFWRFMAFHVFSFIFYMPRAEFFPNIVIFGKYALGFMAVMSFVHIVRKRRAR